MGKYNARQILDSAYTAAIDVLSSRPEFPIHTGILTGLPVPALADYSKHAAMLVVGCRGRRRFSRALFGSVSSGLVHHASCPLAVIHDDESIARPKGPVVVGIDGSPAPESALQIAFDEASRRSADLIAMHAWSDEGPVSFGRPGHAPIEWANFQAEEEEILAERLAGWGARYPDVSVHRVVVADRPVHRLLEFAERAQLLVVGSHGHSRFTDVLHHSVSSAVATGAQIPVIVAHSPHNAA